MSHTSTAAHQVRPLVLPMSVTRVHVTGVARPDTTTWLQYTSRKWQTLKMRLLQALYACLSTHWS